MAWKQDEVFKCPDTKCGCEVKVTKAPAADGGDHPLHCCCGKTMAKPKS